MPRVVRELLERGIRTLSNSLGHKSLEGPSPVGPVPDLINFNDDWPAIKDFKNMEEEDGGESPPREKNRQQPKKEDKQGKVKNLSIFSLILLAVVRPWKRDRKRDYFKAAGRSQRGHSRQCLV